MDWSSVIECPEKHACRSYAPLGCNLCCVAAWLGNSFGSVGCFGRPIDSSVCLLARAWIFDSWYFKRDLHSTEQRIHDLSFWKSWFCLDLPVHTTCSGSFGSHRGNSTRRFSDLAEMVGKHSHCYCYEAAWLSWLHSFHLCDDFYLDQIQLTRTIHWSSVSVSVSDSACGSYSMILDLIQREFIVP